MPGRTTRKCKETLLQVRERLTREQANRTSKRVRELLSNREDSSDSDSEEEQDSNSDESVKVVPMYLRTSEMIADIGTKALDPKLFVYLRDKLCGYWEG